MQSLLCIFAPLQYECCGRVTIGKAYLEEILRVHPHKCKKMYF